MSTLVRPEGRTDGGRPAPVAPVEPSRLDAWRSSWAVALLMARRDVRRHQGRSALVVVMATLPTLLLAALVTVSATAEVSGTEVIPERMGSGQALLEGPDRHVVIQGSSVGTGFATGPELARAIPGFDPRGDAFTNADAVSRVVGSPVVPTVTFRARTTLGGRQVPLDVTALDGRLGLGDRLRLVSGRWPAGEGEALVTASGMAQEGLPDGGQVVVTVAGSEHTLDVVGTAAARGPFGSPDLVVPEPLGTGPATSSVWGSGWSNGEFIVVGEAPVTWPDVLALNQYGFQVTSAAVLRDPPSESELPEELRGGGDPQAQQTRSLVVLGVVMLLLVTALLVGPAFAVSAARQRRTLALVASNGADTPALRRTVLAQALVLGGLSAAAGVALGVATAWAVVAWSRREGHQALQGPFDVRWSLLVTIALCAVASTVVAALVPARRLGRLDIVGVIRGQSVSPAPSPVVFIAGLVLAGCGVLLLGRAASAVSGDGTLYLYGLPPDTFAGAGAITLVVGSLLLLPAVLSGLGWVGRGLPTPLRMAARDLARHRSRSAPSAAAILAAVAALTMGLTGIVSDTEQRSREYLPRTLAGEALVQGIADLTPGAVRAAAPGHVVTENRQLDTGDPWLRDDQPVEPYVQTFANIVPPGCTPGQTVDDAGWVPSSDAEFSTGPPCQVAGTNGYNGMDLTLLPADEIIRRLELTDSQAQAVRDGAAVVRGLRDPDPSGTVRLAKGTYEVDPFATEIRAPEVRVDQDVTVPVIVMPQTKESAARMLQASLLLATDTPTTRDWPTLTRSISVRDPSGAPIDDEVADTLSETLGDVDVTVERGFERGDGLVIAILLGVIGLLVLVVTLTSTALTIAEQQDDDATLAALGATRGTRRTMAAAQAFALAAVGCVLGVAVGLVPGIAFARIATAQNWDPLTGMSSPSGPIIVIPWLSLLVAGALIPLVAGAIAWAGIRRAPQITRRAT